MATIQWKDVNPNFGGSSKSTSNAIQSLSSVGNVFDKISSNLQNMRAQAVAEEQAQQRLNLANAQEQRAEESFQNNLAADRETASVLQALSQNPDDTSILDNIQYGSTAQAATNLLNQIRDDTRADEQNEFNRGMAISQLNLSRQQADSNEAHRREQYQLALNEFLRSNQQQQALQTLFTDASTSAGNNTLYTTNSSGERVLTNEGQQLVGKAIQSGVSTVDTNRVLDMILTPKKSTSSTTSGKNTPTSGNFKVNEIGYSFDVFSKQAKEAGVELSNEELVSLQRVGESVDVFTNNFLSKSQQNEFGKYLKQFAQTSLYKNEDLFGGDGFDASSSSRLDSLSNFSPENILSSPMLPFLTSIPKNERTPELNNLLKQALTTDGKKQTGILQNQLTSYDTVIKELQNEIKNFDGTSYGNNTPINQSTDLLNNMNNRLKELRVTRRTVKNNLDSLNQEMKSY